ncbi:MAG: response regulator transcription factor [Chloroflexi bacterium]|nr:MAG: response regulator transcription factor [Chloroflexota bacterium]
MRPRRYLLALVLALGVAAIAGLAGVPSWHALLAAAAIVLFRVGLELVTATRTVAARPALAAGGAPAAGRLTTRETEIAVLVGEGMTNREIAARLVISERTVDNHVHNILDALDMRHRSQIAAWCAERGLLSRTTTR